MKNKNHPFSCSFWFQEQVLLVKNKRTRILKKISPKTYLLDPETEKKFIPDPGGKKAPDPGSGSATLVPVLCRIRKNYLPFPRPLCIRSVWY
jgi:hypothetical protein